MSDIKSASDTEAPKRLVRIAISDDMLARLEHSRGNVQAEPDQTKFITDLYDKTMGSPSVNGGTDDAEPSPTCDFCGDDGKVVPAEYEGRVKVPSTYMGVYDEDTAPWAEMCRQCFEDYGAGLGPGKGRKLMTRGPEPEAMSMDFGEDTNGGI